nr:hypothetical protein [Tanacetum cinerariifolium]
GANFVLHVVGMACWSEVACYKVSGNLRAALHLSYGFQLYKTLGIAFAIALSSHVLNISWLAGGHPALDSITLLSKASRSFMILLTLLRFSSIHQGSITIFVVNRISMTVNLKCQLVDGSCNGHERLRKITDDMKATNRKDRAGFVSSGEKEARKSALYAAKVGPPKLELVMGRKGDFFCAGKVNNITVDKCMKMGVFQGQ